MSNEYYEPLMPDPKWKQVNSSDWQSVEYTHSLNHPPSAYAQGFDNGAYALANTLILLMGSNNPDKQEKALHILSRYQFGCAKPTLDWESTRNSR